MRILRELNIQPAKASSNIKQSTQRGAYSQKTSLDAKIAKLKESEYDSEVRQALSGIKVQINVRRSYFKYLTHVIWAILGRYDTPHIKWTLYFGNLRVDPIVKLSATAQSVDSSEEDFRWTTIRRSLRSGGACCSTFQHRA